MKAVFFALLLSLCFPSFSAAKSQSAQRAQEDSTLDLFPLAVGNYWRYGTDLGSHGGRTQFYSREMEIVGKRDSIGRTWYTVYFHNRDYSTYEDTPSLRVNSDTKWESHIYEQGGLIYICNAGGIEIHPYYFRPSSLSSDSSWAFAFHLHPKDTVFTKRPLNDSQSVQYYVSNGDGRAYLYCPACVFGDGFFPSILSSHVGFLPKQMPYNSAPIRLEAYVNQYGQSPPPDTAKTTLEQLAFSDSSAYDTTTWERRFSGFRSVSAFNLRDLDSLQISFRCKRADGADSMPPVLGFSGYAKAFEIAVNAGDIRIRERGAGNGPEIKTPIPRLDPGAFAYIQMKWVKHGTLKVTVNGQQVYEDAVAFPRLYDVRATVYGTLPDIYTRPGAIELKDVVFKFNDAPVSLRTRNNGIARDRDDVPIGPKHARDARGRAVPDPDPFIWKIDP